jgi:hypothetical protein
VISDIPGEVWTFLGLLATLIGSFLVARHNTRSGQPSDRSASAAEVAALGARLDITSARLDSCERIIRGLRDYIAADHAEHRDSGWAITPLPKDLA